MDPEPLLEPAEGVESEQWGFEDARAVWVDELDRFVITCTAYGPAGPAVYLATTTDFVSVERHGVIVRARGQERGAFFPSGSTDEWVLFHRPTTGPSAAPAGIVLSRSDDLRNWSPPEEVMHPRPARGGTRSGSASDRRRFARTTAGS